MALERVEVELDLTTAKAKRAVENLNDDIAGLGKSFDRVGDDAAAAFGGVGDALSDSLSAVDMSAPFDDVAAAAAAAFGGVGDALQDSVSSVNVDGTFDGIQAAAASAGDGASDTFGQSAGVIEGTLDGIAPAFTGVTSGAASAAQSVGQAFSGVGGMIADGLQSAGGALVDAAQGIASSFGNALNGAISGVGLVAGGFLATSLIKGYQRYSTIEDATKQLTVALGDATEATKLLDEVLDVVRGTPYGLDTFSNAASLLVTFGVEAEKVPAYLTAIGEAAAGKGSRAEEYAQRLVTNFGQIQTMGRITNSELNQMAIAGVPALQILANEFDVTTIEMREMVSKGAIPATEALDILAKGIVDGSDGIAGVTPALGGSMAALGETLSGSLANFGAAMARFGVNFFKPFEDTLIALVQTSSAILDTFGGIVKDKFGAIAELPVFDKLEAVFAAIPDGLDGMIASLSGFAPLIAPIAAVFGAAGLGAASAALGPLGNLIPVINPLVGAIAALALVTPEFRAAFMGLGDVFAPVKDAAGGLLPVLNDMMKAFGGAMANLVTIAAPALAGLATTVVNVVGDLAPVIGDFVGTVGGAIGELVTVVAPVIGEFVRILAGAFSSLAPVIGEFVSVLVPALGRALDGIMAFAGPVVELVGVLLAGAFQILTPLLGPVGDLLARVGDVLATVVAALSPLAPIIIDSVVVAFELLLPMVDAVVGVFETLVASGAIENLVSAFGQIATAIVPVVTAIFPSLIEIIDSLADPIATAALAFSELVLALAPLADLLSGPMIKQIEMMGEALVVAFGILGRAIEIHSAGLGFIVGLFVDTGKAAREAFDRSQTDAFATSIRGVGDVLGGVIATITSTDLGSFFDYRLSEIFDIDTVGGAAGIVGGFLGLIGVLDDTQTELQATFADIKSFDDLSAATGFTTSRMAEAIVGGLPAIRSLGDDMLAAGVNADLVTGAVAAMENAWRNSQNAIRAFNLEEARREMEKGTAAAAELEKVLSEMDFEQIKIDAFATAVNQFDNGVLSALINTGELNEAFDELGAAAEVWDEIGENVVTFSLDLDAATEAGRANLSLVQNLAGEYRDNLNQAVQDSAGDYAAADEARAKFNERLALEVLGIQDVTNMTAEQAAQLAELQELIGSDDDSFEATVELAGAEEAAVKLAAVSVLLSNIGTSDEQAVIALQILEGDWEGAIENGKRVARNQPIEVPLFVTADDVAPTARAAGDEAVNQFDQAFLDANGVEFKVDPESVKSARQQIEDVTGSDPLEASVRITEDNAAAWREDTQGVIGTYFVGGVNILDDNAVAKRDEIQGVIKPVFTSGVTITEHNARAIRDDMFGTISPPLVTSANVASNNARAIRDDMHGTISPPIPTSVDLQTGSAYERWRELRGSLSSGVSVPVRLISGTFLADGGIFPYVPGGIPATIAEAGAEAVIPLTNPMRALELLEASGLAALARGGGRGPAVAIENAVFQDGVDLQALGQTVQAAYALAGGS